MSDPQVDNQLDFDYRDYARDMYTVLGSQREGCPVLHGSKYGGFWALYGYDDVADAALDFEHFTSTRGVSIPSKGLPAASIPVGLDPPEHAKYRRIVQPHFTHPRVLTMEDRIRAIVVDHLELVRHQGSADLMEALANPVPPMVLGMVLGIDQDRWPRIRALTQLIYTSTSTADAETQASANAELQQILVDEIQSRHDNPRDDALSQIVHGTVDGEPLPADLCYGMVQLLVIAGHETTVFGIGNVLNHILDRPELHAQLLTDEDLVDRVVEESLRLESPVFGMARTVTSDVCVRGQDLATDDKVILAFAAANHDPAMFPDPERFDPHRDNLRRQLAFGLGRHRCLGEHLARMEMRIAVQEVLRILPGVRRATDSEPELVAGTTRGPRSLDVVW